MGTQGSCSRRPAVRNAAGIERAEPPAVSLLFMPTAIPFPKDPTNGLEYFEAFVRLVWILRKECPWDVKQTHLSISHLLIEEAYETLEAIQEGNDTEFSKELGDLLLHVVMHAVIAEQRRAFTLTDVIHNEFTKLVSRHPHVFADNVANTEDAVLQNWERQKLKEGRTSVLDGVPKSLPAALRAQRVQEKAAHVGFDWEDRQDVWAKVTEEMNELHQEIETGNVEGVKSEFGDVLFALINAARHEGIIAEDALHGTINKFIERFKHVEQRASDSGKELNAMSLAEMDVFWDEAKRTERAGRQSSAGEKNT